MKKIFGLFLIVLSIFNLHGQDRNCGTEDLDSADVVNLPWHGKNNWLLNYQIVLRHLLIVQTVDWVMVQLKQFIKFQLMWCFITMISFKIFQI